MTGMIGILPSLAGQSEVVFHRAAFSEEVTIYMGLNAYCLQYEDAKAWFYNFCRDRDFTERLFAYLWNMRALRYIPGFMKFEPVLEKELEEYGNRASKND